MRRLCVDGGSPSRIAILPRGWRLRREYTAVVLEQPSDDHPAPFARDLAMTGQTAVETAGVIFDATITKASQAGFPSDRLLPTDATEACFDADQICRLGVRGFLPGDRIRPLGMNGSRKLHDIFIDHKVPRVQRLKWPLVVVQDEIAWIPELSRARIALVTPATRTMLHLRARPLRSSKNPSLLGN